MMENIAVIGVSSGFGRLLSEHLPWLGLHWKDVHSSTMPSPARLRDISHVVVCASPKPLDVEVGSISHYLRGLDMILANVKRVIYLSSADVYPNGVHSDEVNVSFNGSNHYTALKTLSEEKVLGNGGVVIRLPFLIGRYNQTSSIVNLLKTGCCRLEAESCVQVVTDIYLMRVLRSVMSKDIAGESLNVCPIDTITLRTLAQKFSIYNPTFGKFKYTPPILKSVKLGRLFNIAQKSCVEMVEEFRLCYLDQPVTKPT